MDNLQINDRFVTSSLQDIAIASSNVDSNTERQEQQTAAEEDLFNISQNAEMTNNSNDYFGKGQYIKKSNVSNSSIPGGLIQVDGTDNAEEEPLTIDDGDNGSLNSAPLVVYGPDAEAHIDEHSNIQLEDQSS